MNVQPGSSMLYTGPCECGKNIYAMKIICQENEEIVNVDTKFCVTYDYYKEICVSWILQRKLYTVVHFLLCLYLACLLPSNSLHL